MPYRFQPPALEELPRNYPGGRMDAYQPVSIPSERLHRFIKRGPVGSTVLKKDGAYRVVKSPTQYEVKDADIAYCGGHVYDVDEDEANALRAAGFEVEEL